MQRGHPFKSKAQNQELTVMHNSCTILRNIHTTHTAFMVRCGLERGRMGRTITGHKKGKLWRDGWDVHPVSKTEKPYDASDKEHIQMSYCRKKIIRKICKSFFKSLQHRSCIVWFWLVDSLWKTAFSGGYKLAIDRCIQILMWDLVRIMDAESVRVSVCVKQCVKLNGWWEDNKKKIEEELERPHESNHKGSAQIQKLPSVFLKATLGSLWQQSHSDSLMQR